MNVPNPPYGRPEVVEPGVVRLLAYNPSPFTFTGTQTYIVGFEELVVIDPGPDLADHVATLIAAVAGRRVAAITCTHTHRDHSPAARALSTAIGAPVIGCAALELEAVGQRADASFDSDYAPHRVLRDGEAIEFDGCRLVAVATPGHTSNHLCFALEGSGVLFTGDHVMGWSTSVIVPPDGDMAAYMASLDKLRQRHDRVYYPAHGPAITKPQQLVRGMIGHRLNREKRILRLIDEGTGSIEAIVAGAYPALDPRLIPAAGGSVLAHLVDLERRGMVDRQGQTWTITAQ